MGAQSSQQPMKLASLFIAPLSPSKDDTFQWPTQHEIYTIQQCSPPEHDTHDLSTNTKGIIVNNNNAIGIPSSAINLQ